MINDYSKNWYAYEEGLIQQESVEFVIQINGKRRATIELPAGASESEAESAALDCPRIQRWLKGKLIVRKVFVPDKLLNIVVR